MLNQIIILSALILGSVTDFKKREVPDTLNYSLIVLGLLINLTLSIIHSNYIFILSSIIGLGAGFAIGALFYYTGQWGGGDAKLIMGIGAMIGINPQTITTAMPTFLLFILTSLVVGAVYGAVWLGVLALKHKEKFKKEYAKLTKSNKNKKSYKILLIVFALILLVGTLLNANFELLIFGYFTLIFASMALYAKDFTKSIENSILINRLAVDKLTEGDWIVDELKFKEKTIKTRKTGLSKEDIDYLKQQGVKTVKVREGIPFVPSFFLAYITILLLGNWLLIF
ncbi:MAG: A24 family peptidase [Nanoarchaeota archaeon]